MFKRLHECLSICVQERFFRCLLPWHACLVAACFTIACCAYNLLWAMANLIEEDDVLVFCLLVILVFESATFIIASILLLVSVFKRIAWLLIPWLIVTWFDILLAFTIRFVELSALPRPPIRPCIFSLASLFITTMLSVVLLYCWMAVYTYYRDAADFAITITSGGGGTKSSARNSRIKPSSNDQNGKA